MSDVQATLRIAVSSKQGELFYSGDRMFLGSLDDSVSRFPWPDLESSLDYLNMRLVHSVLFGSPVCARVGNLLYQDAYLPALLQPETSHLVELAKVGFFQIQTKASAINESIAARVEAGTTSAVEFAQRHGWAPGSQLYQRLETLDAQLGETGGRQQYNGEFNAYFRQLMDESATTAGEAFAKVYARWAQRPNEPAHRTRNHFEQDARAVFGDDEAPLNEAMAAANAANHYAYAMALAESHGGSARMPMVETTQLPAHGDLCADQHAVHPEIAEAVLEQQKRKDPINAVLNQINIPQAAYHPSMAPRLAKLAVLNGEGLKSAERTRWQDFTRAKVELVAEINRYLNDPSRRDLARLTEAAHVYQSALYEGLGVREESAIRMAARFKLHKAVQTVQTNLSQNAVTTAAGLALGPLGSAISSGACFMLGVALSAVEFKAALPDGRAVGRYESTPLDIQDNGDGEALGADANRPSPFAQASFDPFVGTRPLSMRKTRRFIDRLKHG